MACRFSSSLLFFLLLGIFSGACAAADKPPSAAIASAHPLATRAGMEVLAEGGNAFDAAVTVSAVLAVVEPYSSGLGGGGFWLLHRASDGMQAMVDGRERAPLAARRNMYLDADGKVIPGLSLDGPLSAAVPGEPAALVHIAKKYGRLPLARTLAPAVHYAEQGFPVDKRYQRVAKARVKVLQRYAASARTFLRKGAAPKVGEIIKQPELARVLRTLAEKGHAGFYAGEFAEKLVAQVRKAGGIWTTEDFSSYRIIERAPVVGNYRGIKVVSVPPPSSGGVGLVTMLNILEPYPLFTMPAQARNHIIVEAMRRAYRDRAHHLGDSDYVNVPVEQLTSSLYADGLRASIRSDRATPSAMLPGAKKRVEGTDTSHFSILDKEGNRVAATLTINFIFGSGFSAMGILLNNEMDDFSIKPGVPNVYGLVGAEANAIAPGKRPLSSMTPTFLESEQGIGIVGTPGGSRIITMVLHAVLDFSAGHSPLSWVSIPRFHHQFLPDEVQYEPGAFSAEMVEGLRGKGHRLRGLKKSYGNMHAIFWDKKQGKVTAASDPRGVGLAQVE